MKTNTPAPLASARVQHAFTRLDLFMVMATSVVLAGLVLPLMASTRPRVEQATCANNLRQIGQAIRSWGVEHGNNNPWRVWTTEGGTMYPNKPGQVWTEFYFIRNELSAPRLLMCPSDKNRLSIQARLWIEYASTGFRGNATSYFINWDAFFDMPFSFLSGDRNIGNSGPFTSCSERIANNAYQLRPTNPQSLWTNSIDSSGLMHYPNGNILYNNGVVEQLPNMSISNALSRTLSFDLTAMHITYP